MSDIKDIESLESELSELKAIAKPTPDINARIKNINKQLKKLEKKDAKTNDAFARQSTVTAEPKKIRLMNTERAYISSRIARIKKDEIKLLAEEFGGTRHINETKVIRAAIRLLAEHTDEEIVRAIKRVVVDEMVSK